MAYFGFLNESKGGEDLILALDRLVQRGYNAHLLMIGGQVGDVDPTNLAYADQIRSLIQARGLAERVQWTGYTSPAEVSAHLLAVDAVVMPYRDGASFRRTTLIAALRHGCPVITHLSGRPAARAARRRQRAARPAARPRRLWQEPPPAWPMTQLYARAWRPGPRRWDRQFDWPTVARQTAAVYCRRSANV